MTIKKGHVMDKFTEIYNTAYDILVDTDTHMMWDYLFTQVDEGNLTQGDAITMGDDIIDTRNL